MRPENSTVLRPAHAVLPPKRHRFLRDGHHRCHRWPTCQTSVKNAHATLSPRIGAAVSAAIPGTGGRVRTVTRDHPAEPGGSSGSPNSEPTSARTTRGGRVNTSLLSRPAWIKKPPMLSSSGDFATCASTVEGIRPRHQGRLDRGADGQSERAATASDRSFRCDVNW
jgi:hypothetical protein